jgi:peroxiredoxin Q/BCP
MTDGPLAVGETAPDFTAPLVRPDGSTTTTAFSELLDDGPVLLSFYTADFSPDCIEEWCAFRDFDWFASGEHVQVVGVSKSRTSVHRRFIDRLGLGFPLYSDRDLSVSEAFGVKYRVFGLISRSKRSCFLVDTDRTVRYVWVGQNRFDPTLDTPPVGEIHECVAEVLGEDDVETFGFS